VRPSDGVAIALRTNAKIYVNKDLLSKTEPENLVVPQTVL
jgi:bifunctional DNase/RNase